MIDLRSDEIHLWLAYYDEINDEQLLLAYRALLNDREKTQEPRFYFAKDRRRYLVTRALVRTVLSRYARIAPCDWVFTENSYGRPEIDNAEAKLMQLSFNISHTHSLIVLGITKDRELGVDVENVCARQVSIDIANRFFAPEEVSALNKVPTPQQQDRFFEYWTFKESYIKARGMGLSIPLDKFSFHFPHEHVVALATQPELADDAAGWQFWQFRPTSEYLVAVCAERKGALPPRVVARKVVPATMDEMLAVTFLKTSD